MEKSSTAVAEPAQADHRRYPRYQVPMPVSVLVTEEQPFHSETAELRDISLTGIYFAGNRAYDTGRHLEIEIALGRRCYHLRVLVQRCGAIQNGDQRCYGTAVLFVRGREIHPFLADLAGFLNQHSPAFLGAVTL